MEQKDQELLKRLLPMFRNEARDHLKVISSGLIEIERGEHEKQAEIVETIYRECHSLKGAARSVNLPHVVTLCQVMENVFSTLKRKEITPSASTLDLLHRAVDCASRLVAGEELSSSDKTIVEELGHRLEGAAREPDLIGRKEAGQEKPGNVGAETQPEEEEKPSGFRPHAEYGTLAPYEHPTFSVLPSNDTVRISTGKLDTLFLQAEGMLSVKIAIGQLSGELRGLHNALAQWKKERARKRSSLKAIGAEPKGAKDGRDDVDRFTAIIESRLTNLLKSVEYDQRSFGVMVDNLLDDTKKTLMFPFGSILEMFPKLVRDLSRDAGKQVDFAASGGEIELDKRVLEEIKDPLIHLVRNCVDHGVETPGERKAKCKPLRGKVEIAVSSRDGKIEIAVSDDGAGIDTFKVKGAAERQGAASREEIDRLSEDEVLALIFRSGLTTSPIITDISGRGLGLAIVRERVEKLNGTLSIDTQPDVGTTLRMVVPITIATFRGVLVGVGEHLFFIPSANVEKVARVSREEIQTVENRETLLVDGRPVSLAKLGAVLELQTIGTPSRTENPYVQVVVLGSAGKRIAFQVDEIVQEQEVLVKSLGPQLSRVPNIAGATLIGNGRVVPVVNVPDLMSSAAKVAPAPMRAIAGGPSKRASVLVVEDSITARALLKTILESTGYDVTTAVDGIDALAALKTREFDLVVSDIEMPRMNGFDLTARIRADRKLSEIPVVLVTALESREDKERGIDVGANAYIVKSSFEQSNLLEVVRRLI